MPSHALMPTSQDPADRFGEALNARSQLCRWRTHWEATWRDLGDHMAPRAYRFDVTDANQYQKRSQAILDPAGIEALRITTAGMASSMASPSRSWARLGIEGQTEVSLSSKQWLDNVLDVMMSVLSKSNFYSVLPQVFRDLTCFGTTAAYMGESDDTFVRFRHYMVGQYWLDTNADGLVDLLYMEERRTVRQLVEQYGYENVSSTTQGLWDAKRFAEQRDVLILCGPNPRRSDDEDEQLLRPERRPYIKETFEVANKDGISGHGTTHSGRSLSIEGFYDFPFLCPRWSTNGEDVYGECPGMDALPELRQLMETVKKHANALDKTINPPLNGPADAQNKIASLIAGDVNWLTGPNGATGLAPVHAVAWDLPGAERMIADLRRRVRSLIHADLFAVIMQISEQKSGMTATEIRELTQEKLAQLGPVVERFNDEFFDPLFDRLFGILQRRGQIPDPPEELDGQRTKVEYVSIVAAAQKASDAVKIERAIGFAGQVSAYKPDVLDRVDPDKALDEYMEAIDAPVSIIVPDEEVEEARQIRAQQIQQQQNLEQMKLISESAKDLASSPTDADNALTALAGGG